MSGGSGSRARLLVPQSQSAFHKSPNSPSSDTLTMAAAGWDIGQIYTTSLARADRLPDDGMPLDPDDGGDLGAYRQYVEQKTFEFLREFCIDEHFIYR